MNVKRRITLVAAALLLSACSSTPEQASAPAKPARADTDALVAQVRAAGEAGTELVIQPLRDPQVEDLRHEAASLEARRKFKAAVDVLEKALAITPGDPDLLQWKAELALHRRAWESAEALAIESFERGPKVGALCRRNWATIGLARAQRGIGEASAKALRQGDSCTVAPPVRM